jgi:ribonuclease HI
MSALIAYIDGSPRGHIGASGIGVVIEHTGGERTEIAESVPSADSNYAEYAALLAALEYAVANQCQRLEVFSDSEVVVRQITGTYTCRSEVLRDIYEACMTRIAMLESFTITHVRREHNGEANRLANLAALQSGTLQSVQI